ncbi:MAG TPA: hypothetical protein EYG73_01620 [Arcobacter sp.]|nr:hypothetical protein [Arcobacter sp.]
MKHLIKYSNFIIFAMVLVIFFIFQPYKKFAVDLSTMLTGEDKVFYHMSQKFDYAKTLLVSTKGFSKEDLKTFLKLKKELSSHSQISITNQLNNQKFQDYKEQYKMYFNDLKYKNNTQIDVSKKLKNIRYEMTTSSMFYNLNKKDPFGLIQSSNKPSHLNTKDGQLVIKDFGYLAVFSIEVNPTEKDRILIYDDINDILKKYENVKAFSSIFYFVENSLKIQNDVKLIILMSMVLLGILYLVVLRNLYLFLNVVASLATSVIVGQLIITSLYSHVSIIALAFSTSITSVSIDYMFHHYLHNYYNKKLGFNKEVFYGYLTTVTAFSLIAMIDYPLIRQISIFSVVSLSVAYIHFAFIYPHLKIKHKEPYSKENFKSPFTIKGYKIIIFTIIVILIAIFNSKFDFDIKNLDYQNEKLIKLEKFFKDNLNQSDNLTILVSGNNIDSLIANSKLIKQKDSDSTVPTASLLSQSEFIQKHHTIEQFNFKQLRQNLKEESLKIGFKEGYFEESYTTEYLYPQYPTYTLEMIKELGFDVIYDGNKYITFAMISVDKIDEILAFDFVINAQTKVLFINSLKKIYGEFAIFGALTFLLIIATLAIVTKKRFLQAFTYILFPMSLILIYSFFVPLNIMHVFMMFIVLAIGIDYGIYMNENNLSHNTTLAIIYSLVSTFAGFGVLIISDINALDSIAITAIIGISGILFLLIFQKRIKVNTKS